MLIPNPRGRFSSGSLSAGLGGYMMVLFNAFAAGVCFLGVLVAILNGHMLLSAMSGMFLVLAIYGVYKEL